MDVTVVGTGTASLRLRRRQSCVVVETAEDTLVFDLGFRAVGGMRGAGPPLNGARPARERRRWLPHPRTRPSGYYRLLRRPRSGG